MNCFEARPQFVDLWRGTLDAESRAALLAHLEECAKCDRAFRTFALTAPMLHPRSTAADSQARLTEPAETADVAIEPAHVVRLSAARQPRTDAARAAEIMRRAGVYRPTSRSSARNWGGVAGAVSMVAAAVLLAYVSVAGPPQSLSDALMATQQLTTPASTHFFGQPMPEIPNDLVG
jgi:Putative zinc-finger